MVNFENEAYPGSRPGKPVKCFGTWCSVIFLVFPAVPGTVGIPGTLLGLRGTPLGLRRTLLGLPGALLGLLWTLSGFPGIPFYVFVELPLVFSRTLLGLPATVLGLPESLLGLPVTLLGFPGAPIGRAHV